jgi:hypothetical protein
MRPKIFLAAAFCAIPLVVFAQSPDTSAAREIVSTDIVDPGFSRSETSSLFSPSTTCRAAAWAKAGQLTTLNQ